MSAFVLDTSVALKWLLERREPCLRPFSSREHHRSAPPRRSVALVLRSEQRGAHAGTAEAHAAYTSVDVLGNHRSHAHRYRLAGQFRSAAIDSLGSRAQPDHL